MPANMVLIRETTLNATAASVTFSSIPQTGYTDLVVKISGRTDNTSPNIYLSINGSTSTFSSRALYGDGASAASTSSVPRVVSYASLSTNTASTFGNTEIYIPNYTSSNNKSYSVDTVSENNATTAYTGLFAGLWSTTSAITSIAFTPETGNFVAGSTFSLYGVAAFGTTPTVVPHASGGDIVTNDGTYWYHAFLSSGTFIPNKTLSCDVLVVAGGGSGGRSVGGGGGAGGLLAFASQSLSTSQVVTVGAGAAEPTSSTEISGNNSQFGSLTAAVGGGGGGDNANGLTGGSGGGASGAGSFTGGTQTSGQGNAGGTTTGGSGGGGAGGGGAGAAGTSNSAATGSSGGIGVNTVTNWGSFSAMVSATGLGASGYFAGGGAGGGRGYASDNGGTGGTGGGGNGGGVNQNSTAGAVNTGGGGGGGTNDAPNKVGRAGGSGIIVVRYSM